MSERAMMWPILACLIAVMAVGRGAIAPALAGDVVAAGKSGAASPRAAQTGSASASPGLPDDPALRQRRKFFRDAGLREHHRKIIAEMLEANKAYRTVFEDGAVKLYDAKISHPLITLTRDHVPIEGYKETEYCASAAVDFPLLPPIPRTARVTINEVGGSEKVHVEVGLNYTPRLCLHVQYDPFPELERARAARRKALGKSG